MKKVLFFVLCAVPLLGVSPCFADCNSPITLGFDSNQHVDDDEFLYLSERDHLLTQQGYENTGGQTSGDGKGYECDGFNSPSCHGGDIVEMPAGHVFEGNVVNKRVTYKCRTGMLNLGPNDEWYPIKVEEVCNTSFGELRVGECAASGGVCRRLTEIDCSGYQKTDNNGTVFNGICRDGPVFVCKAIECREGMRADNGICVIDDAKKEDKSTPTPEPTPTPTPTPTPEPTPTPQKTCVQNRCGGLSGAEYSQCITCCYVPSATAVWNSSTRICECADKTKKFNPSTLQCEVNVPQQEEDTYTCDPSKIQLLNQWMVTYATDNVLLTQINQVLVYCQGTPSELVFNNMFNQVLVLINQKADSDAAASEITATRNRARSRIESAVKTINDIESNLDLSVWKNSEGGFNTSRLLSDSIAGVVLGTAGGLITSSVVKKNQVKSGFEDIQCTVGGQVVAGWGDEFRVGIQ